MFAYTRALKSFSRDLRENMTDAEILLWSRLRNRQVLDLRFYRQRPLLSYIVDFYCHQIKLVIECDGSQHFEAEHASLDKNRDGKLNEHGICVLRFDNFQVLSQIDSVMQVIWDVASRRV